jgi:erythromycin esterase
VRKFTKRSLIIILTIIALIVTGMWAVGIRLRHLNILKLIFSEPMELSAEEKVEVHEWLQKNAINLTTIEAGSGFDDMMPLKAMIGDARIVSLGENAHLNGNFYKIKHRMVEFLVTEMDFTVFAIEASFGCASKINEYLLGGDIDPKEALKALAYKAWRTEEVLDMLIWMREYNSTHDKKVKFYGFDNRPVSGCAKVVYGYLRRTNGTKDYDDILLEWITFKFDRSNKDKMTNIIGEVRSLISYLERQCPKVSQDQKEWSFAVQNSKVLLQYLEFFISLSNISKASDMRDKNMADNVKWIMDYEEGAKAVLWAANAHMTTLPGSRCMGDHLRQIYGNDMVAIGLICNRRTSGSSDSELSSLGTGTLEAFLTQAGLDVSIIDFHSLPEGIVSEFFNSPFQSDQGVKTIYPLSYDAVLFIESTSDARRID